MSLCTLLDIKTRLGLGDDHDDTINSIITGIAAVFASHCQRPLLVTAEDVTEQVTGYGHMLRIKRFPIVSITSIKESWTYEFDDADALTVNTEYLVLNGGLNGVLQRRYGAWPCIEESVQVIYRGGYCAAGVTPTGDEVALPDNLREAAVLQCCFIFQRRDDIGLAATSFDGGSIQKFSAVKLLPLVEQILTAYRRPSL